MSVARIPWALAVSSAVASGLSRMARAARRSSARFAWSFCFRFICFLPAPRCSARLAPSGHHSGLWFPAGTRLEGGASSCVAARSRDLGTARWPEAFASPTTLAGLSSPPALGRLGDRELEAQAVAIRGLGAGRGGALGLAKGELAHDLVEGGDAVRHAGGDGGLGVDHAAFAESLPDGGLAGAAAAGDGLDEGGVVGVDLALQVGARLVAERLEGVALGFVPTGGDVGPLQPLGLGGL